MMENFFSLSYNGFLLVCSIFGLHRLWLAMIAWRVKGGDPKPLQQWNCLRPVTVQLPVFNEKFVVERLIDATCALDYPRDMLEIQVLDDSTDDTTEIAKRVVESYQKQGIHIHLLHRDNRSGYKAGALAQGLKTATGEFIAVFDADFIPAPDFLKRSLHHLTDPSIGMVQTRWGHQNPNDSFLTKLQTVIIDGHFMVDQTARYSTGVFLNFNGSAGVWRKQTILDAGGWHSDTLAEDLDLSYRAQLAGWKFVLLTEPEAVQELPAGIRAFKQQQYRWSKGSLEVAKKTLRAVWRSSFSIRIKIEATFHLLGNIAYSFVALSALISLPFVIFPIESGIWRQYLVDLPLFLICFGSTFLYFALSQLRLYKRQYHRLLYFPFVFAAVAGLSLLHTKALCEVLIGKKTPFVRTPKYGVAPGTTACEKTRSFYKLPLDGLFFVELLITLYLITTVIVALSRHTYGAIPFAILLASGFLYVTVKNINEYKKRPLLPQKA